MMAREATEAIFQKLCEKFKLDGEQDWENAYTLGGELGYSEDEVRNALWIFATDGQRCIEIDPIRIGAGQVNKTWKTTLQVSLPVIPPLTPAPFVGLRELKFSQNLLSLGVVFFLVNQAIGFELLKRPETFRNCATAWHRLLFTNKFLVLSQDYLLEQHSRLGISRISKLPVSAISLLCSQTEILFFASSHSITENH